MSIERDQVLVNLPRRPRRDPVRVPVMQLTYTGPGTARAVVDDRTWRVIGEDGAESFSLALDQGLTLGELVAALQQHAGYDGDVTLGYAAVRAAALIEEDCPLGSDPVTFAISENPLWRFATMAGEVVRRAAARIDIAVQQLNLRRAAASFADYWGLFTGTTRHPRAQLPLSGGAFTVTAGSPLAVADGTARTALETRVGGGPSTAPVGARLVIGLSSATISTYLSKGEIGIGPGDSARLVLAAPWTGETGTFPYRIEWDPEADEPYTARQVRELQRPRESNIALAQVIAEEAPGVVVDEVRDVQRDIFVASRTPLRGTYLPGKMHNAASVLVTLHDFPARAAIQAARTNVAGGVRVFVLGTLRLGKLRASSLTFRTRRLIIGPVPAMKIGVGAIGQSKIGPP